MYTILGQYNLEGKNEIRSITLEAQQVILEIGDMCFKYKKNWYNIAYVAGEEKSRDF